MKKVFSILLCLILLISLCACGGKEEPEATVDTPAAAPTEDTTATVDQDSLMNDIQDSLASVDGTVDGGADIAVDADSEAEPTPSPVEIARGLIDQPIADLYAQIGEPESSDYAPSCMGDGEDGMLFYDGFIVYTYREGDTETVYDVE